VADGRAGRAAPQLRDHVGQQGVRRVRAPGGRLRVAVQRDDVRVPVRLQVAHGQGAARGRRVDGRAARRRAAHGVGHAVLAGGRGPRLDGRRPAHVRHRDGHVDGLRQARGPGAPGRAPGRRPVGRVPAERAARHDRGQGAQHVRARPGARVLERVLSEGVGRFAAVLRQLHRRIRRRAAHHARALFLRLGRRAAAGAAAAVVVVDRAFVK